MFNQRVGVIGLGNIGFPVALNITESGFHLTAFDVSPRPDVVKKIQEAGGKIAGSPVEVASECNVIITLLPNSSIVEEVLLSKEMRSTFAPGTICIDMTSGFPADTRNIERELLHNGVLMIDAPICNGGVAGAFRGELTLCVGGDLEVLESVRNILNTFAKEVRHVGGIGSGHVIKTLSNYIVFTSSAVFAEALSIGVASGLTAERVAEELKHCAANSILNVETISHLLLGEATEEVTFRAALATKDLRYTAQLAGQLGVPSPLSAAAHQFFLFAVSNGYDNTECIRTPWAMLQNLDR